MPELFTEARRPFGISSPAASVNNSAVKNFLPWILTEFPLGKTRVARLRIAPLGTCDASAESFEPGDALVPNEYSVADRFTNRSHYKPFDGIGQRVFVYDSML